MAESGESAREFEVQVFNNKFLEVRKYPVVYDKCSRDFKDKYKKLNAWTQIGKRFGMSPSEADKKYGNIRSSFVRF